MLEGNPVRKSAMDLRFLFVLLFYMPSLAAAQPIPNPFAVSDSAGIYTIFRIEVEGVDEAGTKAVLERTSGLKIGQEVTVPGDPAFAAAIRAIYRLEQFDHVSIRHEKGEAGEVFISIQVEDRPVIETVRFTGLKRKEEREVRRKVELAHGSRLRASDVERTSRLIRETLAERGYDRADVLVLKKPAGDERVDVVFRVETGPQLAVQSIRISGLEQVSERAVRKRMSTTEAGGLKFWNKARFDEDVWQEDLDKIVAYLHELGYFDARIVQDTVFVVDTEGSPGLVASLEVHEGRPYFIKKIAWDGNTRFTDEQLSAWFGIVPGERYNRKKIEENLFGNEAGSDISSRYMNEGYMRFQAQPAITVSGGDSVELYLDLYEGGLYEFGDIEVAGNFMTRDHVVRRELFSIPGESFSRAAIQESVRRLVQTGYFSDLSLMQGPEISIDDEQRVVDLKYTVEEASSPKPQLTGTVGQFGLVLGLGLQYNNFSLKNALKRGGWKPIPSGDGQTIGLNAQANGKAYQQYGFQFTEPWFRGKPAPLGVSISYTHIGADAVSSSLEGRFNTFSASLYHERRLKWPGPSFSAGTAIEYQTFYNSIYDELPTGANRKVSITQSISRNTTNHPVFPTRGMKAGLSVEAALPVGEFIQYHKWRLQGSWNLPLTKRGALSFNVSGDMGYIGSMTGKRVEFERFVLGGSPLDAQGISSTPILGTDVVYFRGYPLGAFGRAEDNSIAGGRVLNKYAAELRWQALNTSLVQATPYLFFDLANTWSGLDQYKPFDLFRSAGIGVRANVPMLGLIEVVYGRNLDAYGVDGLPEWGLQFSIGRSFNF